MDLHPVDNAEVQYRAALYILRENLTGDLNVAVSKILQSAVAYSEALAADYATKLDQLKSEMHANVAKAVESNPQLQAKWTLIQADISARRAMLEQATLARPKGSPAK